MEGIEKMKNKNWHLFHALWLALFTVAGANSAWAATFFVTTTADIGPGSLRDAILLANVTPGPDEIHFAIPGAGVRTINVGTMTGGAPLDPLFEPTVIDGTTQPGYMGTPLIELNGSADGGPGLILISGGYTVRGLVTNRFPVHGMEVHFFGLSDNVIEGNFIGTDGTGTADRGNGGSGVFVIALAQKHSASIKLNFPRLTSSRQRGYGMPLMRLNLRNSASMSVPS
jgi:hypothetical protein